MDFIKIFLGFRSQMAKTEQLSVLNYSDCTVETVLIKMYINRSTIKKKSDFSLYRINVRNKCCVVNKFGEN